VTNLTSKPTTLTAEHIDVFTSATDQSIVQDLKIVVKEVLTSFK